VLVISLNESGELDYYGGVDLVCFQCPISGRTETFAKEKKRPEADTSALLRMRVLTGIP